jgi:ABC-type nickel/cobalt efflux system permease component RcnA
MPFIPAREEGTLGTWIAPVLQATCPAGMPIAVKRSMRQTLTWTAMVFAISTSACWHEDRPGAAYYDHRHDGNHHDQGDHHDEGDHHDDHHDQH